MAEFYVEQQGWVRWPKVLIMCRKNGRDVTRRRYVPEVETGEGMSITDELREYTKHYSVAGSKKDTMLSSIADRIDEEHAKVCKELVHDAYMRGEATADDAFEEMQGTHVKLPVDADGLPIHIGDVMEWPTTGETFEVVGIGDGTLFYIEDGNELADWTGASTKHHYHAPTVEEVLREFVTEFNRDDTELCDDEVIERFASRLRLREDA